MEATLKDVAKLAGLSIGTVSAYINGNHVSEKSRKKIEESIRVLNYTPNHAARSLAAGKSYYILMFMIIEEPIAPTTWLYELPIIQSINNVTKQKGYSLELELVSRTQVDGSIRNLEKRIGGGSVDGIVLASPWKIDERMIIFLEYRKIPYVIIGSNGMDVSASKSVDFDNCTPIYDLVMHQYQLGHRHFGLLGGWQTQNHMIGREKGYRKALTECGLSGSIDNIKYGDYSLESGHNLMLEFFQEANVPTTVICGNDYVAAGAIQAIKEKGLSIPQDISVTGFDATDVSKVLDPPITTVELPAHEIGFTAICMLFDMLNDPEFQCTSKLISSQVIYRDSTGICPRR